MQDSSPAKTKKSVALSGVVAGNTAICSVGKTGNDRAEDEAERVYPYDDIEGQRLRQRRQIVHQRGERGIVGEERRDIAAIAARLVVYQREI